MRSTLLLLSLGLLPLLTACPGRHHAHPGPAPAGEPLREIARAEDINPHPDIVEIELTAAPAQFEFVKGRPVTVLAYNGMLPGPLIECKQGDELIVHFTNGLSEPTTVHWHGIRLPADMDGSHLSQEPVPPGGSFTYRFTVPDAALFWYHPHHNAQEQLYRGLYGPLLVRGADEPQLSRERLLVLSDIGLDSTGQIIPPGELSDTQLERALGVEGNALLVNGQLVPRIDMRPGATERWRVVNAAGARYFNLAVDGRQLILLGVDGGLIDAPTIMDSILLSPGERADLVVQAGAPGQSGELLSRSYQRLRLSGHPPHPAQTLAALHYTGAPAAEELLPATLASIPSFSEAGLPLRHIGLNVALLPDVEPHETGHSHTAASNGGHGGDGHGDGTPGNPLFRFLINAASFPDIPRFSVPLGTQEVWVLRNHTGMDHPFHIHGFRFQVLDIDGVPPVWRGWKDTVNISETSEGDQVIRLLVDYSGHPGEWVYHCHVLFHQEHGMMGEFVVE